MGGPAGGGRRKQQAADTRELLLDAARTVFDERGYTATTVGATDNGNGHFLSLGDLWGLATVERCRVSRAGGRVAGVNQLHRLGHGPA